MLLHGAAYAVQAGLGVAGPVGAAHPERQVLRCKLDLRGNDLGGPGCC